MALTTNVEMLSHSTQETVPIEYISANESKSLIALAAAAHCNILLAPESWP